MIQDLSRFKLPVNFRGRSIFFVQLWWFVQAIFFKPSPQFAYKYRAFLLRLFGAKVGIGVLIRPSVTVTYPWKVKIGDFSWIGDEVVLYSLDFIEIGSNTVISQKSYLCAADHDYVKVDFPIRGAPIKVHDECWIASDVFIAPGVVIGRGSVVGARSSVFSDLPADVVCIGSPCKPIKLRSTGKVDIGVGAK